MHKCTIDERMPQGHLLEKGVSSPTQETESSSRIHTQVTSHCFRSQCLVLHCLSLILATRSLKEQSTGPFSSPQPQDVRLNIRSRALQKRMSSRRKKSYLQSCRAAWGKSYSGASMQTVMRRSWRPCGPCLSREGISVGAVINGYLKDWLHCRRAGLL